ncbi:MAG TPA: MlaD family protein [Thiolinea sp.]|nr:MlaD family protein [Thiolinea sp.]
MNSGTNPLPSQDTVPAVQVRRQRWPSPVWLLPLAAALIGLWLLVQNWMQQGAIITVHFPSAEGIDPGNTQVRYKAVNIGKVKSVKFDANMDPLVTLALNREISDVLDCSAQFWVVRPRIRGAEISGITTLFSGTYIGMLPQRAEGELKDNETSICYQALEEPPATKPNRPGREFKLMTDSMGSLDIGTPIFYKQLQVGEIINYRLSADSGQVELDVFVDEPYYRLINKNTRFWDVSGIDVRVDSVGAEVRMESLTSLLIGGIAFETPPEQNQNLPVSAANTVFNLYPDLASSREKHYQDRLYYTLYFNGSLRGLAEKAPVEFQGIRVGQVEKIKLHLDPTSLDVRIPVLISIEPQRFSEELTLSEAPKFMESLVGRGMRAKLENGNLITGQMFVGLSFDEKAKADTIAKGQFYDVFPTSSTPVQELSKMASGIADDLKSTLGGVRQFMESGQLDKTVENANKLLVATESTMTEAKKAVADARLVLQQLQSKTLPGVNANLETATSSLTQTLNQVSANVDKVSTTLDSSLKTVTGDLDKVSGTLNQSLTSLTGTAKQAGTDFNRSSGEFDKTVQRLQNSLTHLDRLLAQNSPTQYQLSAMMDEVTAMSRAVRALTETLQRQPEALIRGKKDWEEH